MKKVRGQRKPKALLLKLLENAQANAFLESYLQTLSATEREGFSSFSAEYFCANEKAANTCADLVRRGVKVATCSMKYWYEVEGLPMPKVGHLMVVLTWAGEPSSIIQVTKVEECRFREVNAEFAHAEGEGDQTLESWRKAHRAFFEMECEGIGKPFTEEIMLVQEHFHVVRLAGC